MRAYITVLFLVISVNSHAQESVATTRSANELLANCEVFVHWLKSGEGFLPSNKLTMAASCNHTIRGFVDGLMVSDMIWRNSSKSNSNKNVHLPCIPQAATSAQLARVFVNYGEKNPAYLNQDYGYVLLVSLAKAFPYHPNCYK